MPELPEVETVKRVLSEQIIGLRIVNIDIRYPSIVEDDIDYFKNNIILLMKILSINLGGFFYANFI